jgi:hypothetical protein
MTESAFGDYPCSADAIRAMNPLCTGAWRLCQAPVAAVSRSPKASRCSSSSGFPATASTGAVSGVFVLGYGLLRIATEFFREPDVQLGFIAMNWLTMGQLLSILMVLFGIVLLALSRKRA